MHREPPLDLALLQTLILLEEEGSFTRSAARLGRSQAAVSLQIRRLEASVGCLLVHRKKGGGVELNEAGRRLCEQGRELITQSDCIMRAFRVSDLQGKVRLGIWEGYAKAFFAAPLEQFAARYPRISVEIYSGLSCQLFPLMLENKLDALICDAGMEPSGSPATKLLKADLKWVTSRSSAPHLLNPMPISIGPEDCPWRPAWLPKCLWRGAVLSALKSANRAFRVVPSHTTIGGWDNQVLTGEAVTVTTLPVLPDALRHGVIEDRLPDLPQLTLLALKASRAHEPLTDCVVNFLAEAFATQRV